MKMLCYRHNTNNVLVKNGIFPVINQYYDKNREYFRKYTMLPRRKHKVLKKRKEKLLSSSKHNRNRSRRIICHDHVTTKKKCKKLKIAKRRSLFKKRNQLECNQVLGVDRLLAPFNKFEKTQSFDLSMMKQKMVSSIPKTGLTPKERNYVVCNCSQRSTRYARLKILASEAEKNKKIFLINGKYKALREALVERGWVEKIPPSRMDLSTIRNTKFKDDSEMHLALERLLLSNLVQKSVPYFIWDLKDGWESDNLIQNHKIIYNKFNSAAFWATKQGLCSSVRNNHWYYIEGVAEVNSPRTYNSFNGGEKEEFKSDYKLTACTSLLKWVLSMVSNNRPIFSEKGNVSIKVLVFALKRCKEYVHQKQNKDIDVSSPCTTNSQWNAFLKKYYVVIGKQDTFKLDKENKVPLYLGYAKYMLRAIHMYRPELSCEGCYNIWIMKPAHCSRGRGIRLASKLAVLSDLCNQGKFVFQKYIEETLLIHETKFDVRQYYLVTSTVPMVIWMYQDCYLKFSSQKYNLKNYHESIHLTNNAVQRKYKNCTNRHPELPQQNMWSLDTFKEYLEKIGKKDAWDNIIYPGMRKSIVGIMLNCQESTSCWKNRFELYGCDFVLDKDCKPWLIEINSGPDLNPTTKVTAQICPAVLSDVIKVVIDHAADTKASTGKFECIYRQNINMRPCGRADNLIVQGSALPSNYFYRGNLEEHRSCPLAEKKQDCMNALRSQEKPNMLKDVFSNDLRKKKIKTSQRDNFRSTSDKMVKLDDSFTVDHTTLDDPLVILCPSEKLSIVSSPSSNNFRTGVTKINNSDADKSFAAKPVARMASAQSFHKHFDFSNLDDEDDDDGPHSTGCGLVCSNPIEKRKDDDNAQIAANTQLNHQVLDDSIINEEPVGIVNKDDVPPLRSDDQVESDGDHKIENLADGLKKEEPRHELLNATKQIFAFLDRKHKEYIKDEFTTL